MPAKRSFIKLHAHKPPNAEKAPVPDLARVFTVQIDFGNGHIEHILLKPNDDPEKVARLFCQQFSLPQDIVKPLALQIACSMEQYQNQFSAQQSTKTQTVTGNETYQSPEKCNTDTLIVASGNDINSSEETPQRLLQQLESRSYNGSSLQSGMRSVYDRLTAKKQRTANKLEQRRREQNVTIKAKKLKASQVAQMCEQKYQKAIYLREIRRQQVSMVLKQQELEEMQPCTFSPVINKNEQRRQASIEQSLAHDAALREKKLETLRRESLNSELSACSFRPTVSPKSTQIVNANVYLKIAQPKTSHWQRDFHFIQRPSSPTVKCEAQNKFGLLYEESVLRQQRKKAIYKNLLENECTFRPRLVSRQLSASQRARSSLITSPLQVRVPSRNFSFVPTINTFSHEQQLLTQREKTVAAFQKSLDLYNHARSLAEYRASISHSEEPVCREIKSQPRSTQMVERLKGKLFKHIFQLIDSDNDGLITAHAIDIVHLPVNLIKLLEPLLQELESIQEGISEAEFVTACDRLYRGLDQKSKSEFIRSFKHQEPPPAPQPSKPKFNVDFYQKEEFRNLLREERLAKIRFLMDQEQKKQCTFTPNIKPLQIKRSDNQMSHTSQSRLKKAVTVPKAPPVKQMTQKIDPVKLSPPPVKTQRTYEPNDCANIVTKQVLTEKRVPRELRSQRRLVEPTPMAMSEEIKKDSNALIPKYLDIDSNSCTEIEKVSSYVMEDDGLESELQGEPMECPFD